MQIGTVENSSSSIYNQTPFVFFFPKCISRPDLLVLRLTLAPEGDALLLVGLADAAVAIAVLPLARVPVVQVDVGWAVRAGSGAKLRQIAGIT